MEKFVQQNPLVSSSSGGTGVTNPISTPLITSPINSTESSSHLPPRNFTSPRSSETSEVIVYPSSVSLRVCINNLFFFFVFLTYLKKLFFFSHINDKI
jgi:hypothetical protein